MWREQHAEDRLDIVLKESDAKETAERLHCMHVQNKNKRVARAEQYRMEEKRRKEEEAARKAELVRHRERGLEEERRLLAEAHRIEREKMDELVFKLRVTNKLDKKKRIGRS